MDRAAFRYAVLTEYIGIDLPVAGLIAGPGDDEIAASIHGDRGIFLIVARGGHIDQDRETLCHAAGVVLLCVDVPVAPELARPGDDEVAAAVHGHVGKLLIHADDRRVDERRGALSYSGGVVALKVNVIAAAAVLSLAGPYDDVIAVGRIHSHGMRRLLEC